MDNKLFFDIVQYLRKHCKRLSLSDLPDGQQPDSLLIEYDFGIDIDFYISDTNSVLSTDVDGNMQLTGMYDFFWKEYTNLPLWLRDNENFFAINDFVYNLLRTI